MTEPTPPGAAPEPPSTPSYSPPPSAPPSAPPPSAPPSSPYGAPGAPISGNIAPSGYATNDEKTWALVSHFGGAAGMAFFGYLGWLAPLIAMLTKGNESPTVRAHAVAALNFQATWAIVFFIGTITACFVIGFVIFPVAWLIGVIFGVIAGMKANEGSLYKYPMSINMVK